MNQEPNIEYEAFETCAGVPTLTLRLADQERMLPYHGFVGGRYAEARIELRFQDWLVELQGDHLGALWKALQMQDVQLIALASESIQVQVGECVVRGIVLTPRENW